MNSPDFTVNLERIATASEKIASALAERNIIERERMARQFPLEPAKRAAEIIRPDEDKRAQFSDKPTDQWLKETEAATGPSRFQTRLDEQAAKRPDATARGGNLPVRKTQ